MQLKETALSGSFLLIPEKREDSRGFFSRLYCQRTFEKLGIEPSVVQANHSYSSKRGTLRGMHYQLPPKEETKLVRCISGAVYDVILDLREESPTFGCHFGAELTRENGVMMYVPRGFAHGFLTLTDDAEVIYWVSEEYTPEYERGVRWDDPSFSIAWPFQPAIVSERDRSHPLRERC